MAGAGNSRAAVGVVLALAIAGGIGGAWWANRDRGATDRPNVLFIVWDTTRADRMSLYGNERPTTPRIEGYAKDAVVYERAYSADMWTMPSHAAMFTGLPSTAHGVNTDWRWLDSHYTTLPELFSAGGWDTYGFTANQFASQNCNLFQGMSAYDTVWQGEYAKASKQATRRKGIARDRSTEISPAWKPDPSKPNLMWSRGMAKDAGPVAHQALTRWIDSRADQEKPWFAFINMMEAHWPRVPTLEARKQVLDPATLEKGLETDATLFTALSYNLRRHEYTPEEIAAQVGVYDAALVDLDNATADLLDDLQARGLLDDTIVVLTADHGEYLGDHHMFDHRYGLYESMIHVPLVIRYPAAAPARRVKTPVTTAGVWTELARLAGLTAPSDGWKRATLAENPPGPVFSEYPLADDRALARFKKNYADLDLDPWLRTLDAVVDGSYKLISYHDHIGPELYDLAADPGETRNLATEQPERVGQLQAAIDGWKAGIKPYDPALRAPEDRPKTLSNREKQMLEALGYLGEDGEPSPDAGDEEEDQP
jgi:arylsulfatase A-like enzyme